ncbi:hypothetical protein H1Q63_25850 [Desmonostoc muscorum CCALA 125]|nr:hypothetical protein [Desmonostoc muscorum CCALA 125]
MSNLSVFNFESHEIRFVGTADKPWWVASDVCKVLDIVNVSQAITKLDDDEKLMYTLQISGQGRETLCINESGLYSLVLTSRKPQAKRFKKWLTSEVIPSIRKTGSYDSKLQQHTATSHILAELQAAEAVVRDNIARLETELRLEQEKLQNIQKHQLAEAKAFNDKNPGIVQQAIAVARILEKAKANNKYLSM